MSVTTSVITKRLRAWRVPETFYCVVKTFFKWCNKKQELKKCRWRQMSNGNHHCKSHIKNAFSKNVFDLCDSFFSVCRTSFLCTLYNKYKCALEPFIITYLVCLNTFNNLVQSRPLLRIRNMPTRCLQRNPLGSALEKIK